MKTSGVKRALLLANVFNLLVAIYFIVIAIVSLVHLRWYHQLTVTIRVRHVVTSATSYFAFLILIFTALILLLIFAMSVIQLSARTYISSGQDATTAPPPPPLATGETFIKRTDQREQDGDNETAATTRRGGRPLSPHSGRRLVVTDAISPDPPSTSRVCLITMLHLASAFGLVVILVIWLLNTGELVRDSISTQLDSAFARYQFANRSNHYSVAIDGMQDINNCCGSLDYTDFPHQRSGLSSGLYPGSCCGKNIFGANARVLCTPEDIGRARQTAGCTHVLANYYDLISILVVPVSLACLFVNITLIAMITISRGHTIRQDSAAAVTFRSIGERPAKFELKSAGGA